LDRGHICGIEAGAQLGKSHKTGTPAGQGGLPIICVGIEPKAHGQGVGKIANKGTFDRSILSPWERFDVYALLPGSI